MTQDSQCTSAVDRFNHLGGGSSSSTRQPEGQRPSTSMLKDWGGCEGSGCDHAGYQIGIGISLGHRRLNRSGFSTPGIQSDITSTIRKGTAHL